MNVHKCIAFVYSIIIESVIFIIRLLIMYEVMMSELNRLNIETFKGVVRKVTALFFITKAFENSNSTSRDDCNRNPFWRSVYSFSLEGVHTCV